MPAASGAPHDLADVVFRVGRAYGMTADRGIYQAVAVKDGRITAVGRSRDELDSFIGPGTAVIDDPELVLYPGSSSRVARSSRFAGCFRRCRRLRRLSCSRGSAGSTTAAASASSATPG